MYRSPLHSSCFIVFSFVLLRPPCSTLFPYTTLFRSLEELSREVGESVSGAVLTGAEIVYVARVPTRRIMAVAITIGTRFPARSEEHTSELQSRGHLVCRLLLEKKKKHYKTTM